MGLRPRTTRWFEVLVPSDKVDRAAEVLARTGHVQLECTEEVPAPALPELKDPLEQFAALERRYGAVWPSRCDAAPASPGPPERVVAGAFDRLRAWAEEADPLIAELQQVEEEVAGLTTIRGLVAEGGEQLPDLRLVQNGGRSLAVRMLLLAPNAPPLRDLPGVLLRRTVSTPEHRAEIIVAPAEDAEQIDQAAHAAKARPLQLPSWLPSHPDQTLAAIDARTADLQRRIDDLRERIDDLHDRHDLRRAIHDIRRLQWYTTQVAAARTTRNFAVLTGWTDDPCGEVLQEALDEADLGALMRFPPVPEGVKPPVVIMNPAWARPFEVFSRMLGVPSTGEVDPSVVLGIVAPLIFGYMFGDVGQGAVLFLVGVVFWKRFPFLRILVGGGLAAIAFGFVFGSLFSLEHIVPALWVHPMEHPLDVLVGAMVLGAGILLVGILLHGLSAVWQGQIMEWIRVDVTVGLIYVGVLLVFVEPDLALISAGGAAWFVVWALIGLRRGASAAFADFGNVVEHLMRIAVNTVSFVRVGAFALAHAGLSSAVASLAEGTGSPAGATVVLVLGNVLILVLEGIVVSIQTTRLILFEFFVRFLKAEGRPFQPLAPPSDDRAASQNPTPTRSAS